MTTENTKERKQRTPRNLESITKGALSLPLAQMVTLRNTLNESIKQQVQDAKKIAEESEKIANG